MINPGKARVWMKYSSFLKSVLNISLPNLVIICYVHRNGIFILGWCSFISGVPQKNSECWRLATAQGGHQKFHKTLQVAGTEID